LPAAACLQPRNLAVGYNSSGHQQQQVAAPSYFHSPYPQQGPVLGGGGGSSHGAAAGGGLPRSGSGALGGSGAQSLGGTGTSQPPRSPIVFTDNNRPGKPPGTSEGSQPATPAIKVGDYLDPGALQERHLLPGPGLTLEQQQQQQQRTTPSHGRRAGSAGSTSGRDAAGGNLAGSSKPPSAGGGAHPQGSSSASGAQQPVLSGPIGGLGDDSLDREMQRLGSSSGRQQPSRPPSGVMQVRQCEQLLYSVVLSTCSCSCGASTSSASSSPCVLPLGSSVMNSYYVGPHAGLLRHGTSSIL
jgi:hypothetical protein